MKKKNNSQSQIKPSEIPTQSKPLEVQEKPQNDHQIINAKILEFEKGKGELKLEVSRQSFQGPLPHPDILKQYNECYPQAAKIIIDKFSEQVDHRIDIEKTVIKSNTRNSTLGVVFGFILGLVGILSGTYLIMNDKDLTGIGFYVVSVGSLVATFIYKNKKSEGPPEKKE